MKKLIFLFQIVLLGCIQCTQKPEVQVVKVPVYSCPVVEIPEKPNLALNEINEKSQDSFVLKSYGRSIDQLINYQNSLISIIQKQNELSENSKLHQNDK